MRSGSKVTRKKIDKSISLSIRTETALRYGREMVGISSVRRVRFAVLSPLSSIPVTLISRLLSSILDLKSSNNNKDITEVENPGVANNSINSQPRRGITSIQKLHISKLFIILTTFLALNTNLLGQMVKTFKIK